MNREKGLFSGLDSIPYSIAMLVLGHQMYGKVDQVPGLFYVGTNFIHLHFIPLIPTRTYLVMNDQQERRVSLRMSGKSVLFGYVRAGFLLGCFFSAGTALVGALEAWNGKSNWPAVMGLAGLAVLFILLLVGSYRVSRAGALRALKLAGQAGIPPEVVAHYFIDSPELDRLEALRAQQWDEENLSAFDTEH